MKPLLYRFFRFNGRGKKIGKNVKVVERFL